jgi:hypothetical protein
VSVIIGILGCGPELNEPSSVNIGGRWTSTDKVGPLSGFVIDLTQASNGTVSGQWTAQVSPPNPACPPGLGSNPTGPVSGANTVLEVSLSLLGAGDFDGQLTDSHSVTGTFVSCGIGYAVTFSLAGPVPP